MNNGWIEGRGKKNPAGAGAAVNAWNSVLEVLGNGTGKLLAVPPAPGPHLRAGREMTLVEEISAVPKILHGTGTFIFPAEMGIWVDSRSVLAPGRVALKVSKP